MALKKRRHTLHDVANQVGVSYQTVSRVINNHPNVSPDTRERVQKAITDLGYRPNKVAKSLVAKQSDTLGILTFGMNQYGPAQMVLNIERAAKDLGYDLIFSNINEPTLDHIRKSIDSLSGRQVDGILSIAPVAGITYQEMANFCQGIPLVQIDPEMGLTIPSVVVDQQYGSKLITEYLIGLGHRRLGEISGPLNWFGAIARHQQWEATLRAVGLTPAATVEGDWTAASGYHAVHRLRALDPQLTAIVVGNDQMALGAIYALYQAGLRVPEDVSIVGFDDIPEAAYFRPALTTVRQDFNQLGDIGVRYLLERIQFPDKPPAQHILYPKLIVRQSAAPPPTP
jgi:DNA-binding LacI/PurR family transcriptional regulator